MKNKGFIRGLILGAIAVGTLIYTVNSLHLYKQERACASEKNVYKCVSTVVWMPADIKIALDKLD